MVVDEMISTLPVEGNELAEMLEEGDRHFKVKIGRVTFDYYILEREI